ncbi:hypothetical protein [Pseudoneobacillus sp. C159]
MSNEGRIQLNIRMEKETIKKLDEIVAYYQENTKLGRIYKADVLTDIIDKSYELMKKQINSGKKFS